MIRMVLFALGFIAITVTLVIVQPGARNRGPEAPALEPAVTRAQPALTADVMDVSEPEVALQKPADPVSDQSDIARVAPMAPLVSRPVPSSGKENAPLDDQEMRRMTWNTLSGLNQATGRDSAPGQPGSLLHTIVRRSLDGAPAAQSPRKPSNAGMYIVQEGDSLVMIAERVYGDVNMTGPLFAANQSILTRPDDLRAGQTLVLPER